MGHFWAKKFPIFRKYFTFLAFAPILHNFHVWIKHCSKVKGGSMYSPASTMPYCPCLGRSRPQDEDGPWKGASPEPVGGHSVVPIGWVTPVESLILCVESTIVLEQPCVMLSCLLTSLYLFTFLLISNLFSKITLVSSFVMSFFFNTLEEECQRVGCQFDATEKDLFEHLSHHRNLLQEHFSNIAHEILPVGREIDNKDLGNPIPTTYCASKYIRSNRIIQIS